MKALIIFFTAIFLSLNFICIPEQSIVPEVYATENVKEERISKDAMFEEPHIMYHINLKEVPMENRWQTFVCEVCDCYGIAPELIFAICKVESEFNKYCKDSVTGTHYGLMQLGPAARKYCNECFKVEFDYFDEFQNVQAGIFYFNGILLNYPSYEKALIVYNEGSKNAIEKFESGITSTPYSEKVMGYYNAYKKLTRERGVVTIET